MSNIIDVVEPSHVPRGKAPPVAGKRRSEERSSYYRLHIKVRFPLLWVRLTSDETFPFFTQFFQLHASYDGLPSFRFLVFAMVIVGGYIVLPLPFSVVTIIRPMQLVPDFCHCSRHCSICLANSNAAAAAAIVYLAHNGNSNTNCLAICNQFGDFCQKVSGAVVASFIAVLPLMLLITLSAFALRKH